MTVFRPFHVSLSLRAVRGEPALLDAFLEQGLHPELGLDPILMDAVDPAWHRRIQGALEAARVDVALHLPFFDLQPGAADALVREATKQRLLRAMDVAAGYRPTHLVGHAAYDRFLYIRSYADWRDRAVQTWAGVLEAWPDHPPLHLENVHETDPATVAGLAAALRERLPQSAGRIGVCFDVGHWHSFAGGHDRGNLDGWVETLAPVLTHLHLHDNDGTFDQHLAPGTGTIPWPTVFAALNRLGLVPTVTFETHNPDYRPGIAPFLAAYADAFPFAPTSIP